MSLKFIIIELDFNIIGELEFYKSGALLLYKSSLFFREKQAHSMSLIFIKFELDFMRKDIIFPKIPYNVDPIIPKNTNFIATKKIPSPPNKYQAPPIIIMVHCVVYQIMLNL